MEADPISVDGCDRLTCVDLRVYGLEAVLKSAYRFTARAYLHLQQAETARVEVRMRPKSPAEDADVLLREFLNDLIDQRLRSIVSAETAATRELIMAHALSRTNLVRSEWETAEPSDDPFRVARPDDASAS